MDHQPPAAFARLPFPTTLKVNFTHDHAGKRHDDFAIVQAVAHSVPERNSNGETTEKIEAIQRAGNFEQLFADPGFVEKVRRLDAVLASKFHTCAVGAPVSPNLGARV